MAANNKKKTSGQFGGYNVIVDEQTGDTGIVTIPGAYPYEEYTLPANPRLGGYGKQIWGGGENVDVYELGNNDATRFREIAIKGLTPQSQKQQSEFWKWAGRKWREAKAAGRAVKTLLGFQHGGRLVKMNGKLIEVPFENK